MHLQQCTRPDISACVSIVSRYCEKPKRIHWEAVKRILQYLKLTKNFGLRYEKEEKAGKIFNRSALFGNLHIFCDSDWASNDKDTYCSMGGWITLLGNGAISWQSKKGKAPALSSCDAEYIAEGMAAREASWLSGLFSELDIHLCGPIPIYSDSQSALNLAYNPVFHDRSKHIALKFHFTRYCLQQKIISLHFVPSELQIADGLTKGVSGSAMDWMRKEFGLIPLLTNF
jgi:hypothetical protein